MALYQEPMPSFPGFGTAETGMPSPVQEMARVRTKKVFGVNVPERRVRTFLGGLANMGPITPGGGFGNFVQGFSRGLGGALEQGNVYDESERRRHDDERREIEAQRDAERQAIMDPLQQQLIESQIAENEAQAERAARVPTPGTPAPSRGQSLAAMSPDDFAALLEREGQLASAKRAPAKAPSLTAPKPAKVPAAKTKKLADEMGRLDKVTKWEHYLQISQDPNVETETRQEAFRRYTRMRSPSVPAQGR